MREPGSCACAAALTAARSDPAAVKLIVNPAARVDPGRWFDEIVVRFMISGLVLTLAVAMDAFARRSAPRTGIASRAVTWQLWPVAGAASRVPLLRGPPPHRVTPVDPRIPAPMMLVRVTSTTLGSVAPPMSSGKAVEDATGLGPDRRRTRSRRSIRLPNSAGPTVR
jgi:hypothetical protein